MMTVADERIVAVIIRHSGRSPTKASCSHIASRVGVQSVLYGFHGKCARGAEKETSTAQSDCRTKSGELTLVRG